MYICIYIGKARKESRAWQKGDDRPDRKSRTGLPGKDDKDRREGQPEMDS
jgi:hypothetical protein